MPLNVRMSLIILPLKFILEVWNEIFLNTRARFALMRILKAIYLSSYYTSAVRVLYVHWLKGLLPFLKVDYVLYLSAL